MTMVNGHISYPATSGIIEIWGRKISTEKGPALNREVVGG